MNASPDVSRCAQCGQVIEISRDWHEADRARDFSLPYGKSKITCPHCGANFAVIASEAKQSPMVTSEPKSKDEMRTAIITILKRLYPGRTGYNGGHLAPVRDPNPELFFTVLSELEKERIIEYNDTQVALRLSSTFIENGGEL